MLLFDFQGPTAKTSFGVAQSHFYYSVHSHWLGSELAIVADSDLWIGNGTSLWWLETAVKANFKMVIKFELDVKIYSLS